MNSKNIPESQKLPKLSIITQFYPPDYAASGQLIEELATQLTHLAQQLGNAGRCYLESNFTPEIISKEYSKVLSEAVLETLELCPRGQLAVTGTSSRV